MKLLIAEKPSVAADIAKTLRASSKSYGFYEGNGLLVTWALGHLLSAADPGDTNAAWSGNWTFDQLPMLPPQLTYKIVPDKKYQFQVIHKLIQRKDVDEIICCTDAGREGELIFRLIYEHAHTHKPFARFWTSSLTPEAITNAFEKRQPGHKYDNLASAAATRALADWIFGMNLTRGYTILNSNIYNVGRVKTPTMAMVVQRDREIAAFIPQPFYEVLVNYQEGFTGKYTYFRNDEASTRIPDPQLAGQITNEIRATSTGTIRAINVEKKIAHPSQLYNLLNLQKEANQQFGFPAAQTLELAQVLYETHHLITYPRTESNYLPSDMVPRFPEILRSLPLRFAHHVKTALKNLTDQPPIKHNVDDGKLTDHHAIIPTPDQQPDKVRLSDNETKIYDLIVTRFLTMFFPDYIYNSITVETLFEKHLVISRGKEILQLGWRQLSPQKEDDDTNLSESENDQPLPRLIQHQTLHAHNVDLRQGKTTAPKHFTDATLLIAMKRAGSRVTDETLAAYIRHTGIGTPATRAQIIEDLLDNQLLQRSRKQLIATPSAQALYDQILAPLNDPTISAEWEQQLSNIEAGTTSATEFTSKLRVFITTTIAQIKSTTPIADHGLGPCPACQQGRIRLIKGFYGCNRYKEGCGFTLPATWCKKKLSPKHIEELLTKRKTGLIQGFASTKKPGLKFAAYLQLNESNRLTMSFPQR